MNIKKAFYRCASPLKYVGVIYEKALTLRKILYTAMMAPFFKSFGVNSIIKPRMNRLDGGKCIEIGDLCYIAKNVSLLANTSYIGVSYTPEIVISDRCSIGDECNITCINKIYLGKGVLLGRKVLVTDHGHGDSSMIGGDVPVRARPLVSPGPVIIEDEVWIGEKASIMPNVRIGKGSIIGANSVVTKDVPPYSVAVGSPARVVKMVKA